MRDIEITPEQNEYLLKFIKKCKNVDDVIFQLTMCPKIVIKPNEESRGIKMSDKTAKIIPNAVY